MDGEEKLTFIPLLQFFLVKVCRVREILELLRREFGLSITVVSEGPGRDERCLYGCVDLLLTHHWLRMRRVYARCLNCGRSCTDRGGGGV